jgi:hypothetical protein
MRARWSPGSGFSTVLLAHFCAKRGADEAAASTMAPAKTVCLRVVQPTSNLYFAAALAQSCAEAATKAAVEMRYLIEPARY